VSDGVGLLAITPEPSQSYYSTDVYRNHRLAPRIDLSFDIIVATPMTMISWTTSPSAHPLRSIIQLSRVVPSAPALAVLIATAAPLAESPPLAYFAGRSSPS